MMNLIAFLQATQDGYSILHTWLANHDWLEAALKGRILFDVFPVFI